MQNTKVEKPNLLYNQLFTSSDVFTWLNRNSCVDGGNGALLSIMGDNSSVSYKFFSSLAYLESNSFLVFINCSWCAFSLVKETIVIYILVHSRSFLIVFILFNSFFAVINSFWISLKLWSSKSFSAVILSIFLIIDWHYLF